MNTRESASAHAGRVRARGAALLFVLSLLGSVAGAATIIVNDSSGTLHGSGGCADTGTGTCTLADAITFANANSGLDEVHFQILGAGVHTIPSVPAVTDPVVIDGYTQPGSSANTNGADLGGSFTDVPRSYLFYKKVETVLHQGITVGCTATQYCPNDKVRRDQMGIFLARAIAGGAANIPQSGTVGASPYDCSAGGVSLFSDVAPTDGSCRSIHYIASQNVTSGCGAGAYCVAQLVNRADMSAFVARGIVAPGGGAAVPMSYGPDPVTGLSYSCNPGSPNLHFTDISASDSFCKHAHYLWARGIVSGCSGNQYCAGGQVSRGEMAKFLSNAFNLPLYGP